MLAPRFLVRTYSKTRMSNPGHVISIIGTTGVGKSQLSIELAEKFNGEIINADSMQMYKGAGVITNKHPMAERRGVPHHVMNHVEWNDEYDMHRFKKEALAAIDDIHSRGKVAILVGGTHYYLQSVLFTNKMVVTNKQNEQQDSETGSGSEEAALDTKLNDTLKGLTDEQTLILEGPEEELIHQLRIVDPMMANKFHPNDHRRIRRSLEIYFKTGKKASEHYAEQKQIEDSSLRFKTLFLWVFCDQMTLNKRLNERVDKMMAEGGLEDVQELYNVFKSQPQRPDLERGIWQVIGFKEFLPWLLAEPEKHTKRLFKECIELMKSHTRKYSKRQVKWIRGPLHEQLAHEVGHDNCGEVFVLDATDLEQWQSEVNERGSLITEKFLQDDKLALAEIPNRAENFKLQLADTQMFEPPGEPKVCELCVDKYGKPLVIIAKQWEAHLNGSKHSNSIRRLKKQKKRALWARREEAKEQAQLEKKQQAAAE